MNDELDEFERRTREALRASVDRLDGTTRSRLNQARQAALAQTAVKPAWLDLRRIAPAGAVAVAVLATVLYVNHGTPVNVEGGGAFADMELLADNDALDLSQEDDLEFVEWAASMGEQEGKGS
jgi:hypothetical protein